MNTSKISLQNVLWVSSDKEILIIKENDRNKIYVGLKNNNLNFYECFSIPRSPEGFDYDIDTFEYLEKVVKEFLKKFPYNSFWISLSEIHEMKPMYLINGNWVF